MRNVRIVYGALTGDRGGYSRPVPEMRMVYGALTGGGSMGFESRPKVKIVYGALTESAQEGRRLQIRPVSAEEVKEIIPKLAEPAERRKIIKVSKTISPKAAGGIKKALKGVLRRLGEACLRLSR